MSVKPGQEFMVQLQGIDVAVGTVEYVEGDEVTIIIPQTRVVMGLKSNLAPLEREPSTDRVNTVLPDDSDGDGGSPAREAVFEEVPPHNEEVRPQQQQIAVSNESLRNQALDSSVLD